MSREVRRVPLDWEHPVVPNPYWRVQADSRLRRNAPESRLHAPHEMFAPLFDDYPGRLADWEREGNELATRMGHHWEFSRKWHFGGLDDDCTCHPGQVGFKHPVWGWTDDGETEVVLSVSTEDELHAHLTSEHASERPVPADYMPVFDVPADELGWCLYETVTEGTPVTPVFATAEELIDHLATIGQDWGQEPMRREAAERLVRTGYSFGSMAIIDGVLYRSDTDADRLAGTLVAPAISSRKGDQA